MTIKNALGLLAAAVFSFASLVARADEPASGGYRLQILAADAAAVGLFAVGGAAEGENGRDTQLSEVLMTGGIGTFFLGAPTVHAAHGNWGRAGISLVLRTALPLIGGFIGGNSADCSEGEWLCGLNEMVTGMFIGSAVASAADLLIVTPYPGARVESAPETRRPSTAGLSLSPRLVASKNGAMVGVGAQF